MDRKHEIILDIFRLLKELGLPSTELETYIKSHGIGQVAMLADESINKSAKKSLTSKASFAASEVLKT